MKKFFYILILTVGINFGVFAKNKRDTYIDPGKKFIKFYPNPAVSVINFEFEKGYDKSSSFQVYNFIGKKVIDLKSVTQKINIPLTDFYRGVYIYQLRNKTGKVIESGKFQVIK